MRYNKILILLIISLVIMTGCNNKLMLEKQVDETYALGTYIKITLFYKGDASKHFKAMFKEITDIENLLSKNITTSEVSQINSMAGKDAVKVSDITLDVIKKGLEYSKVSDGRFDITIGPLVNLWDIGGENAKLPTQEEIGNVLDLVDYNLLTIDKKHKTVKLEKEGMAIDLGAIAKGYVADVVAEYIKKNNIESAIINLGGNIVTVGNKPDGSNWKIGLQDPNEERGQELGIIDSKGISIVTSGIYERYFEENGVHYHHILSPFDGYPYDNTLSSITILSDKSVDGDGLSTTVFAMGLEEGYKYISGRDDLEAIFITKDNDIYLTPGAEKVFILTNEEFKLKEMK